MGSGTFMCSNLLLFLTCESNSLCSLHHLTLVCLCRFYSTTPIEPRPPTPPPRPSAFSSPSRSIDKEAPSRGQVDTEEPMVVKPSITVIPWVPKTRLFLSFTRSKLEEYLDRYAPVISILLTILLAPLITALGMCPGGKQW